MRTNGKRAFTVVELITVVAILLLLMGAVTTAVSGARRKAKNQQAITEAQQLTDAIAAYENYARPGSDSPLESKATGANWKEAKESNLAFVLGNEKNPNGQEGNIPVLFEGAVRGGSIRDPWGRPYLYRIQSSKVDMEEDVGGSDMGKSAAAIPNINRISVDEVN